MQKIRTAVVGAGFIGPVHVEALGRIGVEVTGILGVSKGESELAAKTLGLPKAYRASRRFWATRACRWCTLPRRTGCIIRWPKPR